MFTGIPFGPDEVYSYPQAKRVLGLLRATLIEDAALVHALAIDTDNLGRGAITGSKARKVWDLIGFVGARGIDSFTKYPHLTIGLLDDRLEAMLTVPNGLAPGRRRAMLGTSYEDFEQRIGAVVRGIDGVRALEPGARPVVNLVQRHYPSQRSEPVYDAVLRFDPRTSVALEGSGAIKVQPQWLRTTFDVLENRGSNVQFQIGVEFAYADCALVRSPSIAKAVAASWKACKPLLEGLDSA